MYKKYLWVLFILVSFLACKGLKKTGQSYQIEKIDNQRLCALPELFTSFLQADSTYGPNFDLGGQQLIPMYDSLLLKGVPISYFGLEMVNLRTKDEPVDFHKVYNELEVEMLSCQNIKLKNSCPSSEKKVEKANLSVKIWYYEKEEWVVFDVTRILKEPGYASGGAFFATLDQDGQLHIVEKSFWME